MSKTLDIDKIIDPDKLGFSIAEKYLEWETKRQVWVNEKEEIQRYIYATDTTKTSNAKLPWSNKTTTPKLCQIRDNLFSNYLASMFPKRKWLIWEADDKESNAVDKVKSIEAYMAWVIDRPEFYNEISKCVLDYIDYGNAIGTVDWVDERSINEDGSEQVGYVGPVVRRINPIDVLLNPTAPNFLSAPKIIRSIISLGEVKEILSRLSTDDAVREDAEELYEYMRNIRSYAQQHPNDFQVKDALYQISGFDNYSHYLQSNNVEVLTFYGDIYDSEKDEFLRNQVIKVVDRHKVLSKRTNPSKFGHTPIYHVGWRLKPDNVWAMGPLDNLVGMQYRIDHLENMKADVFDLIAYPPLKVKGYVDDFEWGPFERIYVGDSGDVEMMQLPAQALAADNQIAMLEAKMEEMAGSPKEAMGFRTPGEKTKYEVQQLENAASRIFQNKIAQFERDFLEPLLNSMLELSARNLDKTSVRVFDQEFKVALFTDMTAEDITGNGRIKPVAARHFAEKAQQVQNITAFFGSSIGADPAVNVHFSTVELARLFEDLLDLDQWNVVEPYIRISEAKDAQMMQNSAQEQTAMQTVTPSGLTPDDFDDGM
jgi:hypothetical protein